MYTIKYKFDDWFLNYMTYIKKYIHPDNIINAVSHKGHYEIYENNPDLIPCSLSLDIDAIDILKMHKHKICWSNLSSNPAAIDILKNNYNELNWYWLSINPAAKDIIMQNLDKLLINHNSIPNYKNYISWKLLHYTPELLDILDLYKESINWNILSYVNNEKTIDYLLKNIDKINWTYVSFNDAAHRLFISYPELVNWSYLSLQPFAINILANNQKYIDWDYLSFNENAIPLLHSNYDKINWRAIMFNKNGKQLIENNLDRICWTEWKIFTKLIRKLFKLDKKVYTGGIDHNNIISDIIYELKKNYKHNLTYFGKCFIYKDLINVDDYEIINETPINFYNCGSYYNLLLRDISTCAYPAISAYKKKFEKYSKQIDRPFATLIKDSFHYIGPEQYNPINTVYTNIEFINIVKNNPDKIEWILNILNNLQCDPSIYTELLNNIEVFTLDFQRMSIEKINIIREELMMKVWHPSNVERWLNSGFTIDDL